MVDKYIPITEAATRGVLCKKVFLEISQNSQENTCGRVSFLINLQARPATLLKKRRWHRYFPVNFAKFLRTTFLQNFSVRLLLQLKSLQLKTFKINALLFFLLTRTWKSFYLTLTIFDSTLKIF